VFALVAERGAASLKDFPYLSSSCDAQPSQAVLDNAKRFGIVEWLRVGIEHRQIKPQLVAGFPVLVGMDVDEAFQALSPRDAVYRREGKDSPSGHALVVVGYDDGRQSYKVMNSWGNDWGDHGFGWVTYPMFLQHVREAYVVHGYAGQPDEQRQNAGSSPTGIRPVALISPPELETATTPNGNSLVIHIKGVIANANGSTAQVVARFAHKNGTALRADPSLFKYRDAQGVVATTTDRFLVTDEQFSLAKVDLIIPYAAFKLAPTGGVRTWEMSVALTTYVDEFQVAQSD
jgi:hypothetical protein